MGQQTPTRQQVGRRGEEIAAERFEAAGFEVMGRGIHCGRHGEIDLVVARREASTVTVAVVEVKTCRGRTGVAPEESVTATKLRRLRVLAAWWMDRYGASLRGADTLALDLRLCVVAVELPDTEGADALESEASATDARVTVLWDPS